MIEIGKKYSGDYTNQISFPLGGIGTGCIGLSGSGRLIDWEIQNKPNKGSINGYSHFAIKAEKDGELVDARILNGDHPAPYIGNGQAEWNYGFGPNRGYLSGVPHFKDVTFSGAYPFANMSFQDEMFPGEVELLAFNPLIPLNDKDSSMPSAFFEIQVSNTTNDNLDYTLALSLTNLINDATAIDTHQDNGKTVLFYNSSTLDKDDVDFGSMAILTDAQNTSYQQSWFRGSWFDELEIYWKDFTTNGSLKNRKYPQPRGNGGISTVSGNDTGTIAAHISLKPSETKKVRFVISWYFPNCKNYWKTCECTICDTQNKQWNNYYKKLFDNALDCGIYCLDSWDRLYNETNEYVQALYTSSLPDVVKDAISANVSILKSPTSLRLTDGEFYGFEGCHTKSGCCEGSCTHVWNYAYALAYLFPKLERSMRELDYKYNIRDDGGMSFRIQLPLGSEQSTFRPCADGQFGGVLKTYREWKIYGKDEWLKELWSDIKKSIEYAWSPTNLDKWDINKTGILWGRQHHTLDMELFGPNSWLSGFYLAALKAGSEMADYLRDNDARDEYLEIFNKGKKWANENLFNGEYFQQIIDVKNKSILEEFISEDDTIIGGGGVISTYWNEEANEIKYQVGDGCIIDQVLAQWHCNLIGLGDIFDKDKTKKALQSIYDNNYCESMRNVFNPCRIHSLNDDSGTMICTYPQGVKKPTIPIPYAQETMHGFEYQVACHMIMEGMEKEGLDVVSGVRNRYDGKDRNPWNEIECGSNYARSMASYSLLLTYSGFIYDLPNKSIGFNPLKSDKDFKFMWSLESGWGTIEKCDNRVDLVMISGNLELKNIVLPFVGSVDSILIDGNEVNFALSDDAIVFEAVNIVCKSIVVNIKE